MSLEEYNLIYFVNTSKKTSENASENERKQAKGRGREGVTTGAERAGKGGEGKGQIRARGRESHRARAVSTCLAVARPALEAHHGPVPVLDTALCKEGDWGLF